MYDEIDEKINFLLSENILRSLSMRNISIRKLSDKSQIPYETLKKILSGSTSNPNLLTCLKIADALDCSLSSLFNENVFENEKIKRLSDRSRIFVEKIIAAEYSVSEKLSDNTPYCIIPLYNCVIQKNELHINTDVSKHDGTIACHIPMHLQKFALALSLPDNRFSPVYFKGDVLIVAFDHFPFFGDIVAFTCGNKFYIGKYDMNFDRMFEAVSGCEVPLISEMQNFSLLGYVVTVLRTAKKTD